MSRLPLLRRPTRTWPAEHSIPLRTSAAGAVCVAIVACAAQHELPGWFAGVSAAFVCAGGAFSYRRRTRPLPYLKILLSAAMFGAFIWFFATVSADAATGQLSAVETPLAVLFGAMQAAHSFDMPSRRDLGFSLAGSATLMAVAGAQAIDLSFGIYVVLWAAFALAGLHAAWSSMAGGPAPRPLPVLVSTGAALLVAALLVVFLPSPRPPSLSFVPDSPGTAGSSAPGHPARVVNGHRSPGGNTSGSGAQGSGAAGVGGFLGFAGPLDTALRPRLGDEVVLRVRADLPTYWVAETYDSWSGRSWTETGRPWPRGGQNGGGGNGGGGNGGGGNGGGGNGDIDGGAVLDGGSPFVVAPSVDAPLRSRTSPARTQPPAEGDALRPDFQTFYLAVASSNVVLHAEQAAAVWLPEPRLYVGADGTIRGEEAPGAGSVYSVLSTVAVPSSAALAKANGSAGLTPSVEHEDLQLPQPYPRVAALARRVTTHATTVLSKVHALERWIGAHTTYTLDVPPLAPGQDSVDQFLFGSRRGFCEQISTSLAVMLRTLGIPAREAVGYVPGRFDPITGLYDEQAKDAHAWVQVWFPGFGWQSFDPTAYVPAVNPSPASTVGHDLLAVADRVPVAPTAGALVAICLAWAALARKRHRPRTWSTRVTRELERAARHAGVPTRPDATLGALAASLDDCLTSGRNGALGPTDPPDQPVTAPDQPVTAQALAAAAAEAAWGDLDARHGAGRHYVQEARRLRRAARHHARR